MAKREIGGNAIGKHKGHACEGHLRAAAKLFAEQNGLTISRSFEISGQVVHPDAVLTNQAGKIVAVIICAYWDHSGSSEKKYYRTRIEYTVTHNLRTAYPELFSDDFKIVTFFYGSDSGWKSLILDDLSVNCRPFVFLPDVPTAIPWQDIVGSAYSTYKKFFEAGSSKARQNTEDYFLERPDKSIKEVFRIISELLTDESQSVVRVKQGAESPFLPEKGYSTRLRQPLSVLSLVTDASILNWHSNGSPVDEDIEFCQKMFFFDMVEVYVKKRADGHKGIVWAHPRLATEEGGRYAPGKPDFYIWCKHSRRLITYLVDKHRLMPITHASMEGAGRNQTYGNLSQIAAILLNANEAIQTCDFESLESLWETIAGFNAPVSCEEWHPCSAKPFVSYPLRDIFACSVATLLKDRSVRGKLGMGSAKRGLALSSASSSVLANAVRDELVQAASFLRYVLSDSFVNPKVPIPVRPAVFSLHRPESFVSGVYNFLTTHPTHNPLGALLIDKLTEMFPGTTWHGWPARRSVPLGEIIEGVGCRREWQVWGRRDDALIFGEVKTITDNNWGNKSKELYDRILDTREACRSAGVRCICICLFDGDLFQEAHSELLSGIGYDFVLGIDTPLPEC